MGRLGYARAATATWSGSGREWCDTVPDRPFPTQPRFATGSRPAIAIDAPTRIGPYRVLGCLGEGGTARVYRCEHTIIGKRVAIKTLLPQFAASSAAYDMFVREARIAGAVRHPNLIDVYDFGTDERDRPYYVMELAEGETLAARLEAGPLALSQCLDLGIRLGAAIGSLHAAGFLHRDIKSENVILTMDGRRMVPKLIDFGISKPLGADATDEPIGMCGTPRTMSPEQISQDAVDERTDIWAMGLLLHEMITGELPFPHGPSVRDDLVAILTEPPRPLPGGIPADVRELVDACLRKDPEERPSSAHDLVGALRAARAAYLARHDLIERALIADEATRVVAELDRELN